MGYLHIDNLYKNQTILLFRQCYALEKVHGTSAHITWKDGRITFFSGGESHDRFVSIFDCDGLVEKFIALGHAKVTVYGEAYGGKCQGMRETYGSELRFIAFDVQIDGVWLAVPDMDQVATGLGLEVVPWSLCSTDLAALDERRDAPSEVAQRRGISAPRPREGVILRPLREMTTSSGDRVIAKHKTEKFSERATPQKIVDPDKLQVLTDAQAIADEWVTRERLAHVLDHLRADLQREPEISDTAKVIGAMVEDIEREGKGEIVASKQAHGAIGRRTAQLFTALIKGRLHSVPS